MAEGARDATEDGAALRSLTVTATASAFVVLVGLVLLIFYLWLRLGATVVEQIEGRDRDAPAVVHHHWYVR